MLDALSPEYDSRVVQFHFVRFGRCDFFASPGGGVAAYFSSGIEETLGTTKNFWSLCSSLNVLPVGVWSVVEMKLQVNRMLAVAIVATEVNFVCRHVACISQRHQVLRPPFLIVLGVTEISRGCALTFSCSSPS
jgi:hypothetical protein